MNRHLVMDLFHGHENEPIGEWLNSYPEKNCKLLVRDSENRELMAYFYPDKPNGFYFYDCIYKTPVKAKEWKLLKEDND